MFVLTQTVFNFHLVNQGNTAEYLLMNVKYSHATILTLINNKNIKIHQIYTRKLNEHIFLVFRQILKMIILLIIIKIKFYSLSIFYKSAP